MLWEQQEVLSKGESNILCLCPLGDINCFLDLDWAYMLIIFSMGNLHAMKWLCIFHAHRRESKYSMNYSYSIFSTDNVPNRAQQREKECNCNSLNKICHCTASAVLLGGYCTIFSIFHTLPSLQSCTRVRRFGFSSPPSHWLSMEL